MLNCKPGDIAVITWDEEPVFSNVGKLVRVCPLGGHHTQNGWTWKIQPLDTNSGHLFIDNWDDGKIKMNKPDDNGTDHPDSWLRPLEDPDNATDELLQEILDGKYEKYEHVATVEEATCTMKTASKMEIDFATMKTKTPGAIAIEKKTREARDSYNSAGTIGPQRGGNGDPDWETRGIFEPRAAVRATRAGQRPVPTKS